MDPVLNQSFWWVFHDFNRIMGIMGMGFPSCDCPVELV